MKKDPQTYAIIGAAMEVHRNLGPGFLEAVYQETLAEEFRIRKIPFQEQAELPIFYKDKKLGAPYKADFVCYNKIIIELKALDNLSGKEKSQVLHYLKASKLSRGLLFNFGTASLEVERFILTSPSQASLVPSMSDKVDLCA